MSDQTNAALSFAANRPLQQESVPPGERILHVVKRQIVDIYQGGLSVLFRKSIRLVELVLAVPLVLAMRILSPLRIIRVGPLPSLRVGPFAANVEIFLCERDVDLHGWRILDLFYHPMPVCNQQLKVMWDRTLHVTQFARSLDRVNRWFPGAARHQIPWRRSGDRDIHGLLAATSPHLRFTAAELRRGREFLRSVGVSEAVPYVCFQVRDASYLSAAHPDRDWSYHNYRNADLHNTLPAIEALTQRGYVAFRMGAIVERSLQVRNPRMIDYSTNGRTEFLDIFLAAHCQFFLSDPSGIIGVPMIFRRPLAIMNLIPFEYAHSWGPQDLFIPKKLWLRAERRFMTFREILESGIGRLFQRTEQYEHAGIEVIENTPEDILALAVEMDERLKGTWQTSEEDEDLQRRFWSLFASSELHGVIRSHLGAAFLRQHRQLLE